MASASDADNEGIASHALAYLRSLDRKLDFVVDTVHRHGERLGRVERDIAEVKRDVAEVKADIALLENKVITAQTEILGMRGDMLEITSEVAQAVAILHRLDAAADGHRSGK